MNEIMARIPDVRIVYFGDTARVPYGNRSKEELIRFGEEIITFLVSQGAETIVVACNTSSATALPALREYFDIPILGMIEPGSRLAVEETSQGKIGLIATETTVRSRAYSLAVSKALAKGILPKNQELKLAWKNGEQPISLTKAQACSLFVPLVEAGVSNSAEARGIARTYLASIKEAGVDTLILGCTHYPFLTPVIREILGEGVKLVDPAIAVVEELKGVLKKLDEREEANPRDEDSQIKQMKQMKQGDQGDQGDQAHQGNLGGKEDGQKSWRVRYFVSGDPELFRLVGNTLLKEPIDEVRYAPWSD